MKAVDAQRIGRALFSGLQHLLEPGPLLPLWPLVLQALLVFFKHDALGGYWHKEEAEWSDPFSSTVRALLFHAHVVQPEIDPFLFSGDPDIALSLDLAMGTSRSSRLKIYAVSVSGQDRIILPVQQVHSCKGNVKKPDQSIEGIKGHFITHSSAGPRR